MPPVEDHPIHEHGVRTEDHRNGCHNRKEHKSGYWARDGWKMNESCEGESPNWVWIHHTMSTKCRYDQRNADPYCCRCQVERDWEYLNRMMKL